MLKEVGASGQISLGKKYAGQLFDMQIGADGAVTLTPVKVVPITPPPAAQEELAVYLTPERLACRAAAAARTPAEVEAARTQWEEENKDATEAMNKRTAKIGSMGRRAHEWANENAQRIEHYNAWAEQRQPYSQRVRQWREAKK